MASYLSRFARAIRNGLWEISGARQRINELWEQRTEAYGQLERLKEENTNYSEKSQRLEAIAEEARSLAGIRATRIQELEASLAVEKAKGHELGRTVDGYKAGVQKQVAELEGAMKQTIGAFLAGRRPEISPYTLMRLLPREYVYANVLAALSTTNRIFASAPIQVWAGDHVAYTSEAFSKVCPIGSDKILSAIRSNPHPDSRDVELTEAGVTLSFRTLTAEGDIPYALTVYAIPHDRSRKKAARVFSKIRKAALRAAERYLEPFSHPEPTTQ